ncbi:hypothetical protein DL93DRAFT_1163516 [Clavulina sp. PMI_390]|nr:hypothetical protein DL93DRAFT_1163516 [Clavulina sp. PMI_390]
MARAVIEFASTFVSFSSLLAFLVMISGVKYYVHVSGNNNKPLLTSMCSAIATLCSASGLPFIHKLACGRTVNLHYSPIRLITTLRKIESWISHLGRDCTNTSLLSHIGRSSSKQSKVESLFLAWGSL